MQRNYVVGKDETADAVIKIWDITSNFVKETRNPSYRIIRNKYGIQELILERRLFSEYYHHLIEAKPAAEPPKPVATTTPPAKPAATAPAPAPATTTTASTQTTPPAPQPAPVATVTKASVEGKPVNVFMSSVAEKGSTSNYLSLPSPASIKSLDLYFDKAATQNGRFNMLLRVYEARRTGGELTERLVYHRCFDEDLSVQLTNYAHTPQNQIYRLQNNVLSLQGLDIHAQHLIVKVDYSLLPLTYSNKVKDLIQQVLVLPVVNRSSRDIPPTPDCLFLSTGLKW